MARGEFHEFLTIYLCRFYNKLFVIFSIIFLNSYWLLLPGGIVKSAVCNCDNFMIYCLISNCSQFIHQSSLLWLQQKHPVAKREKSGREMATELCLSVSVPYLNGYLVCR
jgi:hypothetical protein